MPYFFRMPDVFYTKPDEPTHKVKYDKKPAHSISIRLPDGDGLHPTLFVLHGGKWKSMYRAKQTEYICADLLKHGIATCNIEFRRLGHVGVKWSDTFTDIMNAIDHIMEKADEWKIDRDKISILGHSSGGHLAFCLPSFDRKLGFTPYSMIGLAGVYDLPAAVNLKPEIDQFFGKDKVLSPIDFVPLGIKQLILCGAKDKLTTQAVAYSAAAKVAGDDVTNVTIDNCTHFTIIDPTAECWKETRTLILETCK